MAGSINKVTLIGNLGKDPEVRHSQDGKKIVTFSIATSESWKDKMTGEKKERTEWHRIVIFNEGMAGVAEKYLRKGSKVYIEGQLQTRKWTDDSGVEKYTTEIVLNPFRGELTMLDGRPGGDNSSFGESSSSYGASSTPVLGQPMSGQGTAMPSAPRGGNDAFDDNVPF